MAGIAEEAVVYGTCLSGPVLAGRGAETPMLLFRYIRKAVDAPRSIETNFADPDVLEFSRMWKRVDWERIRLLQFVRFRKLRTVLSLRLSSPRRMPFPW